MRVRRALDLGSITEALSAGAELQHVGLAEALELCVLIRDKRQSATRGRRSLGTVASAER
jgi:hypothetical protein